MRWLIIILLLASCATRKDVEKIEKIRYVDTIVTVKPDIIRAVRPLTFDTIVVENERVRTEVFIDTVYKEVRVESEVKEYKERVKAKEVVKSKKTSVKRSNWWKWFLFGFFLAVVLRLAWKIL